MAGKLFITIFVGMFGVIGASVIYHVNTDSMLSDEPLGRIFGSCLGIAFVAFSVFMIYGVWFGEKVALAKSSKQTQPKNPDTITPNYRCDSCGAKLDEDAEVSPLGDVKCSYCSCWFNIHGKKS